MVSRRIETSRIAAVCVVLLIVLGSFRIVSTYKLLNFTIDEPGHAACGIEWLDGGRYTYEDQHPPLARVAGAVGIKIAGAKWGGDSLWSEGFRILGGGRHQERGLVFGRAAMLPFFWIASAVVALWAHRMAGGAAAICATAFYTTLAPVLAHSGLITTDMALSAMCGLAFLTSILWAEKPSAGRTIVFGIALGLALLSKFSALPFLPCAWLTLLLMRITRTRPRLPREHILPMVGVLLTAALMVWAGDRFDWSGVPSPQFFSGIRTVIKHNAEGHVSYLLGERNVGGFWYYYPVALTAKTPLAMLLTMLPGIILWRRLPNKTIEPLAYSVGILVFASSSRINIGVRHVLPVYTGFAIFAGVIAATLLSSRDRRLGLLALVLMAGHIASVALKQPNYLSYTNELWWRHPEAVLADSDVDWGQDMKRTAEKLQSLGVKSVHFEPFNRGYLLSDHPFPKILPVIDGDQAQPGWTAISISVWKLNGGPRWLAYTKPTLSIGDSILLFHR